MTYQIGDLVIINHVDRPCTDLVAVVTSFGTEYVKAYYVTEYPNMRTCSSSPENVTRVEDFGIEVCIVDGKIKCIKYKSSTATYADGRIREWQDSSEEWRATRQEVLKYLKETR